MASQNQIIADNITSHVHSIYSIVQNGFHIVALDFDSVSGRVFWSDGSQGQIWTAFQNGTDRRLVSTFLLISAWLVPLSWVCYSYSPRRTGPTSSWVALLFPSGLHCIQKAWMFITPNICGYFRKECGLRRQICDSEVQVTWSWDFTIFSPIVDESEGKYVGVRGCFSLVLVWLCFSIHLPQFVS